VIKTSPRFTRRQFLRTTLTTSLAPAFVRANALAAPKPASSGDGELLYNGIRLPTPWPPATSTPVVKPAPDPSYLKRPPAVIPIDRGRQLFVDDFLIEHTTLTRTFHRPELHPANPLITPDQPWETPAGQPPMAAILGDGVWFDPREKIFKLWYMAGWRSATCCAISEDGIRWRKPDFGIRPGTNIVHTGDRDSTSVWLDETEADPARRFKFFRSHREAQGAKVEWHFQIHASPDGIRWSEPLGRSGSIYPRSTVGWNPFRKVWIYSLRKDSSTAIGRCRRYYECRDAISGAQWGTDARTWWSGADALDPAHGGGNFQPQLTNLDAVPYESVMLGQFTLWRGAANADLGRPELNDVCLGFSRDGFHWHRPDRRPFLAMSETRGAWNWGNVQPAANGPILVGDKLHFYFSARRGAPGFPDGGGSTGVAILRRDGFASIDAGATEGTLTTRPVIFSGRHLSVNADAARGELRVEILDENNRPLDAFSRANSAAMRSDSTQHRIDWNTAPDLAALTGKPVKFRFHLRNARLFAFQVTAEKPA
jgi:hypothetical protein